MVPPVPVSEICGKYAAFATPICAVAAASCCSACRTSGRRSISADGRPAGISGGRAVDQRPAALDRSWIPSEQHADRVLLLFDLAPEVDDLRLRRVDELLGLADVEERRRAAAFPHFRELQRFLPGRQRASGDLELEVERLEVVVAARHLRHETGEHRAAAPLARQNLGACAFVGAAVLAPEIRDPRCGRVDLVNGERGERLIAQPEAALVLCLRFGIHLGKLVGARDAVLGARLKHPGRRDTHVEVLLDRGAEQRLQLGVLKDLRPLQLGNGRLGQRRRHAATAIRVRRHHGWTLVVGTHDAAGGERSARRERGDRDRAATLFSRRTSLGSERRRRRVVPPAGKPQRQLLEQDEHQRNQEDREKRGRQHPGDHDRPHDATARRARTARDPERHAARE